MAAIETSRSAPFGAVATYRVLNAVSTLVIAFKNWNDFRVTRNALAALTDRELHDIGLTRGDIDMIGRDRA